MSMRIRHMGMALTREEHDRWHKENQTLTPKQHAALVKKLGLTKEQDEEWHRTHTTPDEERLRGTKSVDPFAVGGGFVVWCVKQGWLVQRGKRYYATKEGERELRERFGIEV